VVAALASAPARKPLRVLVADDDPIVRSLIRSKIGVAGDVVEAADGLEAWQLISKEVFELALVDLEMPNLDGFTLIQCIRSHPATRHIPIIVVTCRNDHSALQRALEAGASSYMTKPLTWSMFNAHVKHLLRLSATAEAAENTLRKQKNLTAARQKLSARLNMELAAHTRRIRQLLERPPQGSAREQGETGREHELTSEVTKLEAAVQQHDRMLDLLDGIDRDDAAHGALGDVLVQACAAVDREGGKPVRLKMLEGKDLTLDCASEAIVHALANTIRPARSDTVQDIHVRAAKETAIGYFVVEISTASAQFHRASETAEIAHAGLLIEAQGGSLEVNADAIRIRLPTSTAIANLAPSLP
jgi:CheY-like chemotaxis protein